MKLLRRLWPYLLLALIITANSIAWNQRQNIADWWRLRDYQPSSEVTALAADTTMTVYGRRLFYVNHPSLEDKQSFNQHCTEKTAETAVLGCYHGNRQGIYIYAVDDERLQGVREVTAAHEMLHQAYDRLSPSERSHINNLLEAYYQDGLTDQAVRDKLDTYKKLQNTVLVNEMHSIFGTEVRNLPEELESYYQQYFTDRAKVVDKREAYQGEFTHRQDTVKQYDAQLSSLKGRITANKALLESEMNFLGDKEKEIAQDIAVSEQAAYEADVRDYNATVTRYNMLLTTTRDLIAQHNDIVKKRNDIAIQEQQLQQALDSRLETPTTKQ